MAIKTDAQLSIEADVIRNETIPSGNTKTRVADMLQDIIDSKPNTGTGRPVVVCGDYNLASNLFPSAGGTGTGGAIQKGNMFFGINSGKIAGIDLSAGCTLMAKGDAPGQTLSNWYIVL